DGRAAAGHLPATANLFRATRGPIGRPPGVLIAKVSLEGHHMKTRLLVLALALFAGMSGIRAQTVITSAFPPEEFAGRRARLMDQIGPDAIAVIRGSGDTPVYLRFRQNNQFFYLTGVQVPNAMLLLDGRTRQATLFLAPRDERVERMDGAGLYAGDDAAKA